MIINKFNIEKWMFDYFENNLTMHEKIEMERFLEANPQYQEEFELWEDSYNSATELPVYEVPSTLLKKSVLYNRGVVVLLGLLFVLFSSVGVYSFINYPENTNVKSELTLSYKDSLKIEKELSPIEINEEERLAKATVGGFQIQANEELESNSIESYVIVANKVTEIKQHKASIKMARKLLFENLGNRAKSNKKSLNQAVLTKDEVALISDQYNKVRESERRVDVTNKMFPLLVPELKKEVVKLSNKVSKENSKYNYLDFKRKENNKRRKLGKSKEVKTKEWENEFWDNFALIGRAFYNKDKKSNKPKFLSKFKNKELALTNTHDPLFIKNNSNPIENNLALVGGLEMTRIKANYSNRWRSSSNELNRGIISVDTYLEKLNAGIGVSAFSAQMENSNLKTSSFDVTYSQRIQLKENSSVNIGVKYDYGLIEKNNSSSVNDVPLEFEQNKLILFSNNFNQENKAVSHNFSSAIWYDGQFLYGGINIDNIKSIKKQNNIANEFAEYINPFKFAIQLGTDYRRNVYSALIISPQVNYRYELNKSDLWLGSSLKYKRFVTGIGLSLSNAYRMNAGIQGDKVRLVYAFDFSKSRAESKFYGTHEISFRYLLRNKNSWNK